MPLPHPLRWQNQQRGLFNRWRRPQKRRGRCSHNRLYQHAAAAAPLQSRDERKEERRPSSSPGTRIWTSEQSENDESEGGESGRRAGPLVAQYKSGIVGHKGTERGAGLQARGTQKYPRTCRRAALFNFNRLPDVSPHLESYITG